MPGKTAFKNKKRYGAKKPYKKAAMKARKQTLEKKVLAIIHKQAEDKVAHASSGSSLVLFNSGITSVADCLNIVPTINNSTGIAGRIGEKIRLKSHTVKGYVRFATAGNSPDAKFSQIMVRQMIVSFKSSKNFDVIDTDPNINAKLATLLQKGGTTTGFTGLMSDIMADINRDVFTVHMDKKYYLTQSRLNITTTGGVDIAQDNSKAIRFFNHSMKVKNKLLHYDADVSASLLPTNYAPIMLFGYCYLDGSAVDTVTTNLGVYYESQMTYEDM